MKATIFDIQRNSYVDGPGIRTTVFFKGCNLRCLWCHNPESQSGKVQMMLFKNKCTLCGKCAEKCPNGMTSCDLCGKCTIYCPHDAREICGKEYTADEVLREVVKDTAFYESSGGGVTFSGGECMLQAEFLSEILRLCKENGIHTAVDTAGDVPWASFEKVLPYTDLFLYDVKAATESLHKEGTGVSNVRILENLARLSAETSADIIVRVPVIGGYNDTVAEMAKIAALLKPLRIRSVELLPYHAMGEHKYEAIGREGQTFTVPDADTMASFRGLFK